MTITTGICPVPAVVKRRTGSVVEPSARIAALVEPSPVGYFGTIYGVSTLASGGVEVFRYSTSSLYQAPYAMI